MLMMMGYLYYPVKFDVILRSVGTSCANALTSNTD